MGSSRSNNQMAPASFSAPSIDNIYRFVALVGSSDFDKQIDSAVLNNKQPPYT